MLKTKQLNENSQTHKNKKGSLHPVPLSVQ